MRVTNPYDLVKDQKYFVVCVGSITEETFYGLYDDWDSFPFQKEKFYWNEKWFNEYKPTVVFTTIFENESTWVDILTWGDKSNDLNGVFTTKESAESWINDPEYTKRLSDHFRMCEVLKYDYIYTGEYYA